MTEAGLGFDDAHQIEDVIVPLDVTVNVAAESIRDELGIDRFASAANTRPVRSWQRAIGRAFTPIALRGLRGVGRRARARSRAARPTPD